jgi:hypothetical protein
MAPVVLAVDVVKEPKAEVIPPFPVLEMSVIMIISACDDIAYFQIFPYLGVQCKRLCRFAVLNSRQHMSFVHLAVHARVIAFAACMGADIFHSL